jgi:hypothetical protein
LPEVTSSSADCSSKAVNPPKGAQPEDVAIFNSTWPSLSQNEEE